MANNPVMNRNPYFREPSTPNGYPSQSQFGQQYGQQVQYDEYGQPVYNRQPDLNQFSGSQAYVNQQFAARQPGVFAPGSADANTMTYDDAMVKTVILLGCTVVSGVLAAFIVPLEMARVVAIVSGLSALVIGFVAAMRPMIGPGVSIAYAVIEGVALGTITMTLDTLYPGVALQAILGTIVVVAVAVGLHMSGVVRTSPKGRKFVFTVLIAAIVYSLINFVLMATNVVDGAFGVDSFKVGGIPLGVILGLFLIAVAGYMLIGDLELVRYAVDNRAPKGFAWTVAFSIATTIIWIYIEVLRVVAILASDR